MSLVVLAVIGVVFIGFLTFLAGPLGFFVAVVLFVLPIGLARAQQRRRRSGDR